MKVGGGADSIPKDIAIYIHALLDLSIVTAVSSM
jgi:hypothetical protein